MEQISIDHSHLIVKMKIVDATTGMKTMLCNLFSSVDKYNIRRVTIDLIDTGDVYNSTIIGTIVGLCKSLIDLNIELTIINSPIIEDKISTYAKVVEQLTEQGITIYNRYDREGI